MKVNNKVVSLCLLKLLKILLNYKEADVWTMKVYGTEIHILFTALSFKEN